MYFQIRISKLPNRLCSLQTVEFENSNMQNLRKKREYPKSCSKPPELFQCFQCVPECIHCLAKRRKELISCLSVEYRLALHVRRILALAKFNSERVCERTFLSLEVNFQNYGSILGMFGRAPSAVSWATRYCGSLKRRNRVWLMSLRVLRWMAQSLWPF